MTKQKANLNQADVELLIEMMKLHFVTHEEFEKYRSDIMDKLDIIIKNTTTTNEELLVTQSIVTSHTERLDRIDNLMDLPSLAI